MQHLTQNHVSQCSLLHHNEKRECYFAALENCSQVQALTTRSNINFVELEAVKQALNPSLQSKNLSWKQSQTLKYGTVQDYTSQWNHNIRVSAPVSSFRKVDYVLWSRLTEKKKKKNKHWHSSSDVNLAF